MHFLLFSLKVLKLFSLLPTAPTSIGHLFTGREAVSAGRGKPCREPRVGKAVLNGAPEGVKAALSLARRSQTGQLLEMTLGEVPNASAHQAAS